MNKEKNYKFSGHTSAVILVKFFSGALGTIKASSNNYGINEHILKFFNDKGIIILENRENDWVKGFKLLTIISSSTSMNFSTVLYHPALISIFYIQGKVK